MPVGHVMCTILYASEYVLYLRWQDVAILQGKLASEMLSELDIRDMQTLYAHELPEFESRTAHLGEFRH